MEASRRQLALLGAILVVLAVVLYWQTTRGDVSSADVAATPRAPADSGTGTPVPAGRLAAATRIPAVALAALDRPQPEPADTGRDPFRFGAAPVEQAKGGATGPGRGAGPGQPGQAGTAAQPALPTGPPPPPPIQLKFIGTARQGSGRLYAVLRDDRGIYYGADGDVVEGRYRVLRVSADAVEISYVDGRGRVNIPLSGGQP